MFSSPKAKYRGISTTILKITNLGYKLTDCDDWLFDDEMLEPVPQISDIEKQLIELKDTVRWNEKNSGCLKIEIARLEKQLAEQKTVEPQYPKFNFKEHMADFCNGKVAVNCRTEESVEKFLGALKVLNVSFQGGDFNEMNWDDFKDETCFNFQYGLTSGLSYDNRVCHKYNGLSITTFEV